MAPFLAARLEELRCMDGFAKGQWAELNPGANPSCWLKMGGTWTYEKDGAISGASAYQQGLLLVCDRDFGDAVEYSGELEFDKCDYENFNAAVIFDCTGKCVGKPKPAGHAAFEVFNDENTALLCDNVMGEEYAKVADLPPGTAPNTRTFLLQQWHNSITVYLDGKLLFKNVAINSEPTSGKRRVGVGSNFWYAGESLTFRHLRVRKLTKPPAATPTLDLQQDTTNPT